MNRTLLLSTVFAVLLLFTTGCWDRRELNDLGIVVGMGIDKAGKQYDVSFQVVNPKEVAAKKGGFGSTPVIVYRASGHTINEAMREVTTASPRRFYTAHLRVVVISEAIARDGMGNVLDLLSRDWEMRTDFNLVVTKGTSAADALRVLTPLESIPASGMFKSLEMSEKVWAPTLGVTLDRLINDLVSEGKHPVLTGLQVRGERAVGRTKKNITEIEPSVSLKYFGLAVFKRDKLIGWLNEDESKGYNYIRNNVRGTVGHMACPEGGKVALQVVRSKTKLKGRVVDGNPSIDVEVRIEANVGEVECRIDLTKMQTIAELEKRSRQKMEKVIKTAIANVQKKYKVDIFGFGEEIHRADPKAWKRLKHHWDKEFTKLPVNVTVETKIRRLGTVSNSFLQEMKK